MYGSRPKIRALSLILPGSGEAGIWGTQATQRGRDTDFT
jgi:hypothetical protein